MIDTSLEALRGGKLSGDAPQAKATTTGSPARVEGVIKCLPADLDQHRQAAWSTCAVAAFEAREWAGCHAA